MTTKLNNYNKYQLENLWLVSFFQLYGTFLRNIVHTLCYRNIKEYFMKLIDCRI